MKTKLILPFLLLLTLAWGCSITQRRIAYNSLATVAYTTDAAVRSYLDMVVRGQASTNSLPIVAKDYQTFQMAYNAAIELAQTDKAPAPQNVIDLSGIVIKDINAAKGVGQ